MSLFILIFIFFIFIYYYPNILGHPDNYIPANPMKTPLHIVPEWYFLPFYAILRSIPNKIGGVIAMFSSLIILLTNTFYKYHLKFEVVFLDLYLKFYMVINNFFFNFRLDWSNAC